MVQFEHVEGVVDGLFLGHIPLVNLKDGRLCALGLRVLFVKVILELTNGDIVQTLALLDLAFDVHAHVVELVHVGYVEALAHKRVADLLDALVVASSTAEDDQIGSLLLLVLRIAVEMGQGESAGRAEKHLLHALHLFVLDGTGEEGEASFASSTAWVLNVTTTVALRGHGALEAMNHSHEEADDLLVVLLPVDVALDFVDGIALLNHEILARAHLVLDRVEQHVSLLAQLLLNQLDELEKLGPVTRLVNLD